MISAGSDAVNPEVGPRGPRAIGPKIDDSTDRERVPLAAETGEPEIGVIVNDSEVGGVKQVATLAVPVVVPTGVTTKGLTVAAPKVVWSADDDTVTISEALET